MATLNLRKKTLTFHQQSHKLSRQCWEGGEFSGSLHASAERLGCKCETRNTKGDVFIYVCYIRQVCYTTRPAFIFGLKPHQSGSLGLRMQLHLGVEGGVHHHLVAASSVLNARTVL